MAHYAKLDENNNVIDVVVIADKDCLDENGVECEESGRRWCELLSGHVNWKKTSYNTQMGLYYKPNTDELDEDQSKVYRLNFAQVGMKYDEDLNAFVVTENFCYKNFPTMVINPQTGYWILPKPTVSPPVDEQFDLYPIDEFTEQWHWSQDKQEWIKFKESERQSYPICYKYEEML